jgi:hypothetical protein
MKNKKKRNKIARLPGECPHKLKSFSGKTIGTKLNSNDNQTTIRTNKCQIPKVIKTSDKSIKKTDSRMS